MSIKKNFFAPLSKGLGATRRAAMLLLVMMLTTATAWADGISYLDATGTQQSCTTYTTVESSSTLWNSGWYVVSSSTTIADRITVSGTVNLILCDGATLTASKGITVGSSATFNIYAQTNDEATMGALVADGTNDKPNWYAGIGGVENTDAGMITINGGQINATGWCAAGIGSGGGTSTVGTITINGGIVTAQDNAHYGAGIGGGFSGGKAGTINLNGGVINAAGIGSGYFGGDCSITVNISDGVKKIVATPVQGGACIGKGKSASGSVTVNFISGGNIVTGDAKDAVFYDTGEGAQRQVRAKAMNHAVTMSDDLKANITATSEYAFTGETVTLTLGTAVDATTLSVNDGAVATTDAGNRQYTFTMPDGDVTVTATLLQTYAVSLPANMEVVSATNAADADGKYITGTTVTFKASFPYAASNVSYGTSTLEPDANGIYTVTVADADVTITATVERSATIDLTDAPGDFNAIEGDVLTGTTSHTVTIAADAGITLSGATISGGIVCEGTATITLVGTNSVSGATNTAGIQIGGSGTTLTINGDGTLTANGGDDSAGIGLNRAWNVTEDVVGGNIVINGGNITANGGGGGAGIGAGVTKYKKNAARTATVGNITIAGGSVTAVGGSNADGIGAGQNNYNATIQIGTIKIYDGIEKVDASAITESVTYMHVDGNTETDVTASASTYFTITEDGDRRVIVPKDNTDYNITIADGIEHGTLTGAATAKYMEKVTITATPALGYRFSRLVVKDAQNNNVESTGNSFFMPKSNVTVSAVFEQGTHGTTEFEWLYQTGPEPEDIVLETIYDGVTTVNIQNSEMSYKIRKYEEYTYSKFLLDNNTYDANIPYAGGTGEFYGAGNGTNFNVPYNGQTGYYDITLTDVGNGKWGVSILPTAAQMDVVPDQTYTGSAITPEPLVIAGSLSLTKGTDYTYSYENNTNVGTATVRATFQGDYESLGYVEKEFTIVKATPTVNAPTAVENLIHNGSAQALVNAGSTDFGTLLYSLDGETYSEDIPTATSAGTHTVYYKVAGDNNHNDVFGSLDVTIAPKAVTNEDITVTIPSQTWTGNELTPVITVKDGEIVLTENTDYTVTAPSGPVQDSGNYTYTITGMGNYSGETAATFTIAKSMTNDGITIADIADHTYTGSAIEPEVTVTDGETTLTLGTDYTIGYSANVNVGTATATITGKGNYSGEKAATFTIIPKAVTNEDISITIPSQTRTGSAIEPAVTVKDGKTTLTLGTDYEVAYSNNVNAGTATATITGMGNYAGSREAMFTIADQLITADGQTISDATTWKNRLVSITGNSTVTFSERITISGTVTLNLGEGATLIAPKGIEVDKGNTLTIEGNGALNATADKFYAAIGRGFHDSTSGTSGTININGGTVTAIGGRFAAAIGGGYEGVSGTINISGGTIVATGGYCAAGIGGGTFAACGVVNISGGQVTANGDRASGIGPGFDAGTSGTVTLGWTNESDGILASNYNDVETLRVADGKAFTASTGNIYIGTLDDDQRAEFAGKTLKPVICTGVSLTKESQGLTATIDGTSTATINIPTAVSVDNVTYNRTFTVGKASTVMLPFNYTCNGEEGGTFYKFVGVEKENNVWVATMQETGNDANSENALIANTPYLFMPTATGMSFPNINGSVTLFTRGGSGGNCETAESGSHWTFKGTYSYVKWTTDSSDDGYSAEHAAEIGRAYGFAGVEKTGIEVGMFVKIASGAKIRPMCCYLLWNDMPNSANARSFTRGAAATDEELPQSITVRLVGSNGEVTSIGTLDTKTGELTFDSEAWYTLDGVRLSGKPTKKGLYINNGRKVVIK